MHYGRAKVLAALLALAGPLGACAPVPLGQSYPGMADRRFIAAVNFSYDSYRIPVQSYPLLDNTAAALNDPALAGLTFDINGHTDASGLLGYNISLSLLRATAVAEYLAARGVPRERMRPQGFGPLQLLDSSNPRSPANRRVEIVGVP